MGGATGAPVLYEKHDAVAVLVLNRPHVLNAYDVGMRDALYEHLRAIRDDPEVRCVVLRGNGPAFSTGGDLLEFGSTPSPVAARRVRWQRDVWGLLCGVRVPTLAAVHGYVVGGGFEMALLCDLCLAADDARFAYPETGLGMIPGVGGTQTTPRLVGIGRALDLILRGRALTADEARRWGLVTRVVPGHQLVDEAMREAAIFAALDRAAVAALKEAVTRGLDLPLVRGLALERRLARRMARQARADRRDAHGCS